MRILILALLAVCPLYAQSPSIVFSEIMWMGSSASSADEWIELYNAGKYATEPAGMDDNTPNVSGRRGNVDHR